MLTIKMNDLQCGASSLLKVTGLVVAVLSSHGLSTPVQAQEQEQEKQLLWGDTHLHLSLIHI